MIHTDSPSRNDASATPIDLKAGGGAETKAARTRAEYLSSATPIDLKERVKAEREAALVARAEYLSIEDVCALYDDSRSAIYRDARRREFMRKRGIRTLVHVPTYLSIRGPQEAPASAAA
jgi:hypothetical protein